MDYKRRRATERVICNRAIPVSDSEEVRQVAEFGIFPRHAEPQAPRPHKVPRMQKVIKLKNRGFTDCIPNPFSPIMKFNFNTDFYRV